MEVTTKEIKDLIKDTLSAGLVPFVTSAPGLGKSDIVRSIASEFNLELIDVRLSQMDASDICGYPQIQGNKMVFVPSNLFPIEGDPLPKGKDGFLLFLDEMNSAPLSVQAASFKLVLDRMIGNHKLHKNVAIVAAGNRASDKGIVNRLSTPMQSRMVHFNLIPNSNHWIEWGEENGVDHRIISFIQFRPELLHNFNPSHDDNTFSCPRTWHFLSKIIKNWKKIETSKLPIITGTVGNGAGMEFMGYLEVVNDLPTFESIVKNPLKTPISDEGAVKYAITGLLSTNVTEATMEPVFQFIERLPGEFQVLTIQSIKRKHKDLSRHEIINKWIRNNAKRLL